MGLLVCNGASLMCSFGAAPSTLIVPPLNKVLSGTPAANIMDFKPMMNILPFGMCQAMSNPAVAAATAAKLGVFTPMPCIPVVPAPWAPGCPKTLIGGMPALNNTCKAACVYGGVISITYPGQATVMA